MLVFEENGFKMFVMYIYKIYLCDFVLLSYLILEKIDAAIKYKFLWQDR